MMMMKKKKTKIKDVYEVGIMLSTVELQWLEH